MTVDLCVRSALILCCIVIKNSWQACKTNSNISQHFGMAPNVQSKLELKKLSHVKRWSGFVHGSVLFQFFFGLAGLYNSPKFQFTELILFILFLKQYVFTAFAVTFNCCKGFAHWEPIRNVVKYCCFTCCHGFSFNHYAAYIKLMHSLMQINGHSKSLWKL